MVKHPQGYDTEGWWNDVHCENMNEPRSFICAYDNVLCPEDWYLYNGHCYFASVSKANFEMARQMCKDTNTNAELVSVHDQAEDDEIADHQVSRSLSRVPKLTNTFSRLRARSLSWV